MSVLQSAVHVPCCPSFRFKPWKWRGLCFGRCRSPGCTSARAIQLQFLITFSGCWSPLAAIGGPSPLPPVWNQHNCANAERLDLHLCNDMCRSLAECYWFGIDRTRWSRTTYALGLGREYRDPFTGIGRSYPDEIAHLCESSTPLTASHIDVYHCDQNCAMKARGFHCVLSSEGQQCSGLRRGCDVSAGAFVCCLGCAFGLGLGQAISICGNYGVNFAACFTCHAREKMRRHVTAEEHLMSPSSQHASLGRNT